MNVQLLLLLALVGPFCAFTHASPTTLPAEPDTGIPEVILDTTETPKQDLTVVTGPSTTEPVATPGEATTEVATTEVATEATPPAVMINTEEPVGESVAPATTAAEPLTTDPPAVETAAPAEPTTVKEPIHPVDIESELDEGLSSGQVAGIVIAALLALAIVIAVVIVVVRRMGKYSSAKNKKPAKKESVMVSPLKKKSAKQQEHPKFWKF